ncbi:MAG: protein-disulfide reductase DsbD family protein [Planctomycetota bacterium]
MRPALPCFALLVLASFPALGGDEAVTSTFSLDPPRAAPGQVVELRVDATIPAGWYLHAGRKPDGISLEVSAPAGLVAEGDLIESSPTMKDIPYVGQEAVHLGKLRLVRRFKVAPDAAAGTLDLPATFGFTACNEKVCFPPAKRQQTLKLEVTAPQPAPPQPQSEAPPVEPEGPGDPLAIPGLPGESLAPERVALSAGLSHSRVPPGALVEVRVEARPGEHWHIFGLRSPSGLPTKLTVQGAESVGPPSESPAPKVEEVEYVGTAFMHYGPVRFKQVVRAPATPGKVNIEVKVAYQACDPNTCISGDDAFTLALEVAADAPPTGLSAPAAEASPPAPSPSPAATGPGPKPAPKDAPRGLAGLIGASFLLGLAMLLMPCTYPMIPITISVFSKGQQLSRGQTLTRAAAYALGIVLSFLLVGGVVQVLVGGQGQVAINAFATNAWVNLVIGVVFVYFAFSFFGYYELGLPAPLQRVLATAGAAKTASDGTVPIWSLFLMGLFFVLTSYTCGAPVVLGLFVTAATAPHPASVLLATFVFSVTVAAPFFFLALAPNAIRLLPRSGSWFSVFKVVLGLVELGFAVKFFRGVDLQWGTDWDILTRPVTLGLWLALALTGAVYLLGRFPLSFPHDPPLRPVSRQRMLWAAVLLGVAGYFAYGLTGKALAPGVEAFILAKVEQGPDPDSIYFTEGGLSFGKSLKKLEEGQRKVGAEGRMFLMFTGHNCSNCVQMEHGVLPLPKVMERLKGVPRVALFIDVGEEEARHRDLMVKRYDATGAIPLFYVIDGKGEVKSAQVGACSEAEFLRFLEAGGL